MKPQTPSQFVHTSKPERILSRLWIALLVTALGFAFLFGTGFQTQWNKERHLVAVADEIVTALKAYRDGAPGTAISPRCGWIFHRKLRVAVRRTESVLTFSAVLLNFSSHSTARL